MLRKSGFGMGSSMVKSLMTHIMLSGRSLTILSKNYEPKRQRTTNNKSREQLRRQKQQERNKKAG